MRLFAFIILLLFFSCGKDNREKDHVPPLPEIESPTLPKTDPNPEPKPIPEPEPLPPPKPEPKPVPKTIVEKNGFLKLDKSSLVNEHGEPLQLKGMSLFWSQWAEGFYNSQNVKTLAEDWNVSVVRAAMGIENGGYLSDPQKNEALIETVVNAAIAEGIYVIIDWHDHNAHLHAKEAFLFFSKMAEKYKNTPNVIFEIFNEPLNLPWTEIKAYADPIIKEIRRKGSKAIVVVGTRNWSQEVAEPIGNKIDDDRTMYALHFYAGTHRDEMRERVFKVIEKGIPIFVTEFGLSEAWGGGYLDYYQGDWWVRYMLLYKVSWINWSITNKSESSAALQPFAKQIGPWSENEISESGRWIRQKLR